MATANGSVKKPRMSWEQIVQPCGQMTPKKGALDFTSAATDQLGTYTAAVSPLLVLILCLVCGVMSTDGMILDPRTNSWLWVDNNWAVPVLSVLYVLFSMVWGPQLMRDRKPYQLKEFMLAYNALQVVCSFYMFIESGASGWFLDYNYRCQPCNFSQDEKPVRMARVAHWFFLSKALDFVDTGLFVLRGKLNQVSNLHVIHHSCMFVSMWFGLRHQPGGHYTFLGFLNSFVHTVMYSYYLLAALGPKVQPYLWWKKYLTRLQLTQFVFIFLHSFQLVFFHCEGVGMGMVIWTLLYSFIFFAMFVNFYVKAYLFRNKAITNKSEGEQHDKDKVEQTTLTNGHHKVEETTLTNGHHSTSNGTAAEPNAINGFLSNRVTHRMPNGSSIVQ